MVKEQTTKCYITRDEGDNKIYLWLKPTKGNWSPQKLPDCDIVNWQRQNIDNVDIYLAKDFKKKFQRFLLDPQTIPPLSKILITIPAFNEEKTI